MNDFQNVFTDEEIEQKWRELEDVLVYEDAAGRQRLSEDWWMWETHTEIEDIWHWFDMAHTKGVGWLMENI